MYSTGISILEHHADGQCLCASRSYKLTPTNSGWLCMTRDKSSKAHSCLHLCRQDGASLVET